MLHFLILKIRDSLYRHGLKKVTKAEVPTICVGNITVGGTGKTPHTEMILRELLASDKWGQSNISVLSRGYKRTSRGFQQVTRDGTAAFCGDEPIQIKRKFPAVTVAVDKDRVEGCRFLVHPEELQTSKKARKCKQKEMPASDLIILDDAFQYRKLQADLDIVLVDYNRPVSKDCLMPLGHLRDLKSRLRDAGVIIVTKCPTYMDDEERIDFARTLGFKYYNPAKCIGTTSRGQNQTVLFTCIRYGKSEPVFDTSDPRYVYSKKMVLFSGIADDRPLMQSLSDKYKIVKHLKFADHHRFTSSDFSRVRAAVKANPTTAVATTEKDAQRVLDFHGVPDVLRERMFMVPIEVVFLTDEEHEIFRNILLSI